MPRSFFAAVVLCLLSSSLSYSQNSQSTIFFYRSGKSAGAPYEVTDGSTLVGRISSGTVKVYRCEAGSHEFIAKGKTLSSFRLDTEAGKEYFVACGQSSDSSQRATFRQAPKGESRMEIKRIDEVIASQISATVLTTSADTVRALRHLFKRKHGWGVAFTIVGTLGIVGNSVSLINYEPEQIPIGYGLTIEQDRRPSLITGLLSGFILSGIGISRLPYYKQERLDAILEDRAGGGPFPAKVTMHLKPRDFQTTVSSVSK